jgi:ADP-ribose pyrophosphatase YjhB (NUDIX family)
MALPGGKLHGGEGAEAGALRELHEELGLDAGGDGVLGLLDDFDTRSGFTITPVIVWSKSEAGELHPFAGEVAELFLLGLADLQSAVRSAKRGTSRAFCLELPWGPVYAPTAAILYQFSEVALDGRDPGERLLSATIRAPLTWRRPRYPVRVSLAAVGILLTRRLAVDLGRCASAICTG